MDAVVEYERLDLVEGMAAAAASFVSMLLSLQLAVAMYGSTQTYDEPNLADMTTWLLISVVYAGPIWLAGFLVIGLPAAAWIERRTPMSARHERARAIRPGPADQG